MSRAKILKNETDEATKRILAMSNETVDIGGQTLKELDDQGSRLTRIEEELDNIYKSLGDAEEYLDDLKRLFGKCLVPCTSTRSDIKYDIETAENGGGKSATKPKKTRTKMNKKAKADERDEYLNNLNLIRNNVSTLKNMVLEMDEECETQNEKLKRINEKAKANEQRLDNANKNAEEIFHSEKPCCFM